MDENKSIEVQDTEEMKDTIDVTPEMIQVATEILWESGRLAGPNPQALAISCRQRFQLGRGSSGSWPAGKTLGISG
jgi:hypothetical protein